MEPAGTLERGLTVLRTLAAEPRQARATDLVRATGLARSTVDRVLATLAQLGYVRLEERAVLLAPRLMELGEAYLACGGLRDTLSPLAERLAEEVDDSVSLAVRDADGVRFVSQFTRRRTMSVAFRVGDLLPADRCAAGLVLLDPAAPWAEDDQLIEPGLIAVAVPVRDAAGEVACALSVVSHTSRHTVAGLRAHALPRMRATVAEMEAALSGPAPVPAPRPAVPAVDTSRAVKQELGAGYLQSLARGLAVLVSLGSARGGLTLAEAAKATGLPRATVRRAVQTLERLGYATAEGSRFVLLPRVLELGYADLSGLSFGEIVQPHLADLVARVHESASVAVLSGDDVVYVARVPTVNIMRVNITVGTRFPAYATSMGRVLLAGVSGERLASIIPRPLTRHTVTSAERLATAVRQAAADGYALVDQELEEGVRSIAVPVRDRTGRVVAAVNVATHAGRATRDDLLRDVLPALTETAARMEADLAHTRVTPLGGFR
ncbi:IclR family pca regulon transcriptional regulator [Streptosporangium becharense]|uniref:IclR family pca regulon transcriptional regulator n=1 Tax=Streptosporangium becharense TaxID=1816182 RepID=A0A7W9MJY3_9ACTN|nr:IclR family transcriptional regulator C-terminal domain-containing protein [Streptosporangium becharense]MBB2910290.1 IclR family pca regulon transcriptional regulator [Streptosporangium becharense]MBB5823033.1 IclR family pca regulon transcriptional regulator [Streptosporangium becharense]